MASGEQIKVLIVESLPQAAKRLENLLSLIENVQILSTVSSAMDAHEKIRQARPEVALVGINLPEMNGINFTEIIRKDFSHTQVVIVAPDKLGDTVLHAMRTGASDFLTHDVSLEELNTAIQRAGELSFASRKMPFPSLTAEGGKVQPSFIESSGATGKIVAVYSPKGGAGVTTLAINLAIALQKSEATVALVDASIQFGDVAILLNEVPKFSVLDLVSRINDLDKKILEDVMVLHRGSGLHLLAAPPRPELADKVDGNSFARILEFMRQVFTCVIVNTSAYITDPCLAALDAGDANVLITSQDLTTIRNTRSFLDLWSGFNMSKDRMLMAINRYQKTNTITKEKISEHLNHPVQALIPEDEETVVRSSNLGIPFLLEKKGTSVEKSINVLSDILLKKLAEPQTEERYRLFAQDLVAE